MDTSYLRPVIDAVERALQENGRAVLAIDGMSASGKTTAADALSILWNAPVVRMDDFFLPPALRTDARLREPGGNVHYERFEAEVLPYLRAGEAFSYRVFDCGRMDYGGYAHVAAAPVVIVEGAYAMHPRFKNYADVSVFFSITPEEQERRIRLRNGGEGWIPFRDRWIPMENAYHAACDTRARADITIEITA